MESEKLVCKWLQQRRLSSADQTIVQKLVTKNGNKQHCYMQECKLEVVDMDDRIDSWSGFKHSASGRAHFSVSSRANFPVSGRAQFSVSGIDHFYASGRSHFSVSGRAHFSASGIGHFYASGRAWGGGVVIFCIIFLELADLGLTAAVCIVCWLGDWDPR